MIGIKFIKVQPTTYLLQYRGGTCVSATTLSR